LLCYQTLNLLVLAPGVDLVWPWFYLEWQTDVDTITKVKKAPPKQKKLKAVSMVEHVSGKRQVGEGQKARQSKDSKHLAAGVADLSHRCSLYRCRVVHGGGGRVSVT
jgi:hypothetical protein